MHDIGDAAVILIGGNLRDAHVFLVVQQHALARAAGDPKTVHTSLNVEFHDLSKGRFIELALRRHGSDNRRQNALKFRHDKLHLMGCSRHVNESLIIWHGLS